MQIYELAVMADVIVTGEIAYIERETFDFSVDAVVLGDALAASLCVERFVNWTCHGR